MDLIGVIGNAGQGLGVFQAKMATASNNIANANTPGYSRQTAVVTETIPEEKAGTAGYIGRGATLQGVVQSRDQFVEAQINTAFANSSSTSAQSDALSTVTALDPGASGGITDALGNFYSALRDLNQNPGDLSLRQAVVNSTQAVATAFNQTATSLSSARTGIDENLTGLTNQVNGLLSSVATLNNQIALAENSGGTPNDMLDVRQNDIDQLAQLIGAKPVPDDHGNISIILSGGDCLVSGNAAVKLGIQANSSNNGHLDIVYTPTDGSAPSTLTPGELGGEMGGLVNARDAVLGQSEANLNTMAYDFTTAVNAQSEQGYALDGTQKHDLFAALPNATDAALNMAVDPSTNADPTLIAAAGSATSGPGDSTNLQAMIATENTKLSNGLDAEDGMAKLTSDFGIAVSTASQSSQFDQNVLSDLQNARQSASGVSVDDEMVNLMQAQNAYTALAKVITTSNSMLTTLMAMF
jgi:flagellar hook-associated protein 1 FlgK